MWWCACTWRYRKAPTSPCARPARHGAARNKPRTQPYGNQKKQHDGTRKNPQRHPERDQDGARTGPAVQGVAAPPGALRARTDHHCTQRNPRWRRPGPATVHALSPPRLPSPAVSPSPAPLHSFVPFHAQRRGAWVVRGLAVLAIPPRVHVAVDEPKVQDPPVQHRHRPGHEPGRVIVEVEGLRQRQR